MPESLPPTAQSALDRARAAFDANEMATARREVERLLTAAPTSVAGLALRGDIAFHTGEVAAAAQDYARAIALAPDFGDAHYGLGLCQAAQGDHEAAIAAFTQAIELEPERAELYADRALSLEASGLPVNALLDYDEALERDADFFEAALGRGQLRHRLRQFGGAIGDLSHAIDLAPAMSAPYLALVAAALDLGDAELAFSSVSEGLESVPRAERPSLHRARAQALMALSREREALADWDALIASGSPTADDFTSRGEAHLEAGNISAALADFERAIALDPIHQGALAARAEALATQGQTTRAIAAYGDLLRAAPTALIHNARGDLHFQQDDFAAARADYEAATTLDPALGVAWHNLGLTLATLGEAPSAQRAFDRAIESDPTEPEFFRSRAELAAQRGHYYHAWLDWTRALDYDEEYIEAYKGRGDAAWALGDSGGALDDYAAALDLDPNFGAARAARAQLFAARGDSRAARDEWAAYLALPPEEQEPDLVALARQAL